MDKPTYIILLYATHHTKRTLLTRLSDLLIIIFCIIAVSPFAILILCSFLLLNIKEHFNINKPCENTWKIRIINSMCERYNKKHDWLTDGF